MNKLVKKSGTIFTLAIIISAVILLSFNITYAYFTDKIESTISGTFGDIDVTIGANTFTASSSDKLVPTKTVNLTANLVNNGQDAYVLMKMVGTRSGDSTTYTNYYVLNEASSVYSTVLKNDWSTNSYDFVTNGTYLASTNNSSNPLSVTFAVTVPSDLTNGETMSYTLTVYSVQKTDISNADLLTQFRAF